MAQQRLIDFLKAALRDEAMKRRLAEVAAEFGYDIGGDEVADEDLERAVGGVARFMVQEGESGDKDHGSELDILP